MTRYTKNPRRGSEHLIHTAFVEWVDYMALQDERFEYFFHPRNQGRLRDDFIWGKRGKKEGVRAGVPDLLCLYPSKEFNGLALEFKYGKNGPTKEQLKWLKRLAKVGYSICVPYSLDRAIQHTKYYFCIDDK